MDNRKVKLFTLSLSVIMLLSTCHEADQNRNGGSDRLHWNFEYNDQGLLTKTIDPGGKVTEMAYQFFPERDILQKIEKKTEDGLVTYTYNELEQPIEMEDKYGKVKYTYDQVGNLTGVSRENLPSISYTYNTSDQVTSVSLSNGQYIEYHYDFLGRMAKMETPAGDINYNYYTGDGIVERQLPNGIRTQYQYLPNGKLESISHIDKNNYILTRYTYSYNAEGLISSIVEWTTKVEFTLRYEFDQVDRLIAFMDRDGTKTEYAYDAFGNRTEVKVNGTQTESYTYDGLGRMLTRNGVKCEYDNSGNLLTDHKGEENYTYNGNNQLEKAGVVSYAYDGDGLLYGRNTHGKKTEFVNNPLSEIWQPLLARSDDNRETFYIWEGNTPVATIEGGKATFFLADHLGSVRGITDDHGKITEQIHYTPFGIPDQTVPLNGYRPGFTGLFYESETQLYLTKARAYDPNTSRFLQIDPIHQIPSGTQKDLSLFAYCGGDPVNNFDKIGTQTESFLEPFSISNAIPRYSERLNSTINWWKTFASSYVNHGIEDFNYFFHAPRRDVVIYQIIDHALKINTTVYGSVDYEEADILVKLWRQNKKLYKERFPNATSPSNGEFQIASNIMLAKSTGWIGFLSPFWTVPHYVGERTGITPHQMTLGIIKKEENTWQRQTWKTVLYPFKESIKQTIKNIDNFITPPAYGNSPYNESFLAPKKVSINGDRRMHHSWVNYWSPSKRVGSFKSTTPSYLSNVGGVYLGGAGKAFQGLGQLSGIAIDESNGKLVLISEGLGTIDLPPLRMDDVVSVFQSVYQHGEAPFVSIDPDPLDPKGPTMNTSHGASTNNTYVGWVLFETDRIMKAYSLGEDNISNGPVKSAIEGYDEVLNKMFAGNSGGNNWERFWIVPDKIEKSMSGEKSLTMMSVPLKVNTQKMVMRNGKLETAPNGKSSQGAEAFSRWFSENYDEIADEVYSLPPSGSGFYTPVPVFRELQRIALITAIAEQLRDQGIVYPFWMRGYEVHKFPIPKTTPSHTVTRKNGNMSLSVFGGVNLSVPDDQVFFKTLSTSENKLAEKLERQVITQPYLEVASIEMDNNQYMATVLPGSHTKDLGACILNETDLIIPIKGEYTLSISRKFNSFVAPTDNLFGKTWTLDLPFLEAQKIPEKQTDGRVQYKMQYHLISPLNSYYKKIEMLYVGDNKKIGTKTTMVSIEDGTNLHFNEKGYLVAYEQGPVLIRYNRDANNNLFQIVGFYGQDALADIKLKYDHDRLIEAEGSNGDLVKYVYSEEGNLLQAIYSVGDEAKQQANIFYEYKNGLVTGIKINDELVRRFIYNEKGQLIGEISPGNREVAFNITSDQNGTKVVTFTKSDVQEIKEEKKSFFSWLNPDKDESSKENSTEEFIQYDASFRPVKEVSRDGLTIEWDYSDKVFDIMEINPPWGDKFQIKQSKDSREITYSLPGGGDYEENYDEAGHLLGLKRNNVPMYEQNWHGGMLTSTEFENSKVNYEYDEEGIFKRTLITPPGENKTWNQWVEYRYDEAGNVAGVADYSGMKSEYEYSQNGELSSIISNQGKIGVKRNQSLVEEIETSWGDKTRYYYGSEGQIRDIQNTSTGGTSAIKFADGQITEISQSNGSKYQITYYPEPRSFLVRQIQTPVNTLDYHYGEDDQLLKVLCNDSYEVKYNYDESGRIKQIQIGSR